MDRTKHNQFNAMFFGFSGNEIHAYMDRGAKTLRQKHRELGHDIQSLLEMCYNPIIRGNHKLMKYTPRQIWQTWMLHRMVDGWDAAFGQAVRNKVKGYGTKKENMMETINKLKTEIMRF